jgi:hypothetical protein
MRFSSWQTSHRQTCHSPLMKWRWPRETPDVPTAETAAASPQAQMRQAKQLFACYRSSGARVGLAITTLGFMTCHTLPARIVKVFQ